LMICSLCSQKGHDESRCKTPEWCTLCKDKHYPSKCNAVAKTQCETCGEKGHLSRNCTSQYIYRRGR
jgi:hypothetical protein